MIGLLREGFRKKSVLFRNLNQIVGGWGLRAGLTQNANFSKSYDFCHLKTGTVAKNDPFRVPKDGTSVARIENANIPQNGGRDICFVCL